LRLAESESASVRAIAQVPGLFAASEPVGIPSAEVIAVCDGVVAEWQEWGRILDVDTRAVPPFAELGVANRKLQQAALTDALTGLYNRRYALDRLDREWAIATRSGQPLACLVIDIDHFKRVNDTYGHDVGDLVLLATAKVLCDSLRQSDVVCRLGGEEFVVIGPGMDWERAALCAERLRAATERNVLAVAGGKLHVTLSIGAAVRTARTQGPACLLKAADETTYAAKQGGRNRVCLAFAPEEASPPAPSASEGVVPLAGARG
jgi:diguanylate cyclase (GGDEF)-like protein